MKKTLVVLSLLVGMFSQAYGTVLPPEKVSDPGKKNPVRTQDPVIEYLLAKRMGQDHALNTQIEVLTKNKFESVQQSAVLVGELCGFAGCDRVYLVTDEFRKYSTGPTQDVILSRVTIPAVGEPTVTVLGRDLVEIIVGFKPL